MRAWALGLAVAATVVAGGCASPVMKATPFYTGEVRKAEGPPEDRVNLWPLAYYRKPALSILWPVAEVTDDHVAVRPVFSVYKLDKKHHQWNLLWPLAQLDFDTGEHRVVPVFWGEHYVVVVPVAFFDEDLSAVFPVFVGDDYTVVFPLVWWYDETKAIFPALWWEDGAAVLPLFWYQDGDYCHLLPLWWHWEVDGGSDTHVLWPVFRWLVGKEEEGWRAWPLAGHYAWTDGHGHYSYALWPLCHDWRDRDRDERTRVAFPLYFEHGEGEDGWWLLLPLALHSKDGKESLTLTPLWSSGRSDGRRWDTVLPLFYRSVDEAAGTERWLTPLGARVTSPERTRWTLLPLLSSVAWSEEETELWAFAPLAHAGWDGEHVEHHVLPFYYYYGAENMLLTPLVSWREDREDGFLNIGTLLFHYGWDKEGDRQLFVLPPLFAASWDETERDVWLPWPLGRARWGGPEEAYHLWPLFGYQRGRHGRKTIGLLLSELAWGGPDDDTRATLFPLLRWQRLRKHYDVVAKSGEPTSRVTLAEGSLGIPWLLSLFSSQWRDRTEQQMGKPDAVTTAERRREWRLFPLAGYEYQSTQEKTASKTQRPTRKGDGHLLWRLFDWQLREGTEFWEDNQHHDYARSRVLWRLMHYERLDGDRTLDVFPFITWDRRADGGRQFSFLWRFFRSARAADGGRKLDVLFVPVWRREGGDGG